MSQNPPLPQQSTSPHPQHKGFSFTRTFFALIGTAIVSVVFTACSDPELDEDFIGDNDARLHEYFNEEQILNPPGSGTSNRVVSVDDLDAEIDYELDAQDVYYIKMGRPPLTDWERCMYRADRKHITVTSYCGKLPTSQQE